MKETSIRNLACYGISVIIAWAFIHQGWMKTPWYTGGEDYVAKFRNWGFEPEFLIPVAMTEIAVGLMVLFPRTSSIGAAIGVAVMVGAIYTHLSTNIGQPWFALILLILCIIMLLMRWPESILNRARAKSA